MAWCNSISNSPDINAPWKVVRPLTNRLTTAFVVVAVISAFSLNKRLKTLPSSSYAQQQNFLYTAPLDLTPQESEQLSEYVSDDAYVQKQKKDIKELTELFKGMMEGTFYPLFICIKPTSI